MATQPRQSLGAVSRDPAPSPPGSKPTPWSPAGLGGAAGYIVRAGSERTINASWRSPDADAEQPTREEGVHGVGTHVTIPALAYTSNRDWETYLTGRPT